MNHHENTLDLDRDLVTVTMVTIVSMMLMVTMVMILTMVVMVMVTTATLIVELVQGWVVEDCVGRSFGAGDVCCEEDHELVNINTNNSNKKGNKYSFSLVNKSNCSIPT